MDPLSPYRDRELDLAALCEAATGLLAQVAVPADKRVAAVPDARTVRYYQTLGVVDRPLRYEGRQAVYGTRHLLQVVATKLLQARGESLAHVQQALSGASTDRLEAAVRAELGVAPAPPPQARPLVSAEIAPGVFVTLDPSRVPDTAAVLQTLGLALATRGGSS